MLHERHTKGIAVRDGQPVATVVVTERAEVDSVAGQRPRIKHHPARVRFLDPFDGGLRSELMGLRIASDDPSVQRQLRATGGGSVSFDIELDDGRTFGACVGVPTIEIGPGSEVSFPLSILGAGA
jgi:hypothetical protein